MEILKNNIETIFLKQWADHFKEPVVLVLETGEILFSNNAAIGLFGIKGIASPVSDVIQYFFLSDAKEEWQRILNEIHVQKEYYVQCSFLHSEHGNLYLDIKCNALNHTHQVCYIFQVLTIKDGLEESLGLFGRDKDIFEGILRNTNEAVFFVEQYTRTIIDCNKRAIELFEADSKEELIGLKGPELHCYPMFEEDRARAVREEELPNGWDWELLYQTRKNRKFWGRINVLKLKIENRALLLVRITDIDNEKKALEKLIQSEKKYRDLITYNQALICTHDMNGIIISANPACQQALEVAEKDLIGKTIGSLFDKNRILEYHEYLRKINEEEQVSGVMEVLNRHGQKMYWLYHNYKVVEEGEEPYVVGSAKDITERMRMEKELIQAKIQAISSLKARELFLANVSHEIRTPMNGIIGVLELMNKTSLNNL
ncbi:MAG: PAS domain S-box protein, partial [Cytophagales bacterium]|nr:PAS domain S-box protein [Cytophaga sp.]